MFRIERRRLIVVLKSLKRYKNEFSLFDFLELFGFSVRNDIDFRVGAIFKDFLHYLF